MTKTEIIAAILDKVPRHYDSEDREGICPLYDEEDVKWMLSQLYDRLRRRKK